VIVCLGLLTQRESDVWIRCALLLALGVVLYLVTRATSGPADDLDADKIG
jgi:hypothetical protein